MRDYEYDLVLNPDINCKHHHQWFYFEVGVFGCLMFQDLGRVVRRANKKIQCYSHALLVSPGFPAYRVSSTLGIRGFFTLVRRDITESAAREGWSRPYVDRYVPL